MAIIGDVLGASSQGLTVRCGVLDPRKGGKTCTHTAAGDMVQDAVKALRGAARKARLWW